MSKTKLPKSIPKTTTDGVALFCAFDHLADVTELVPNPRNPKRHPERQLEILARVIRHQGWRSPVVVSDRSGFIVAGHGRYEAAKLLGLKQVPVNLQHFETEADEHAHMLADNRIAELAETDEPELKALLIELKATNFDLGLAGLTLTEIDELNKSLAGATPPPDFDKADETIHTEHECPKCGFKFSGGKVS